ncbi:MAG TPA: hypothetical protein VHN78_03675, partial [Chloroflexota bacterium]|nr:hypothetical protein [Chloroflexota bacterium]
FGEVHGQFEARLGEFFGSTIVGSFQDELPSLPTWGRAFAEEFRKRCGYDLRAHLASLWEDLGPESAAVRYDYHRLRAELAEEALFRPLFEWHERHGLLCGFDQQGPVRAGHPIEAVDFYADYLRTHRWYGAPGSDHHGEARIHASLAHLYDRPRVWIEAFHSSGWGGTLEETFDWLLPWLRAGATLYDPHAVYYATHGGWWEWAPPSTCWRQPYWPHYRHFATAVTRLCAVLSQGMHLCDVGVLFPTATVQAGLCLDGARAEARAAHEAYLALAGSMHWNRPAPGVLDHDRRDFDVLDDASVQRAVVGDGALQIGAERYRAIILPACTTLEGQTAQVLERFVAAGGRLVAVGAVPQRTAGHAGDQGALAALVGHFEAGRAQLVAGPQDVPAALAALSRLVEAPVPALLRRAGGATVLFLPAAFPGATRQGQGTDWRQGSYDFDPARYARELTVTVRGLPDPAVPPELWELSRGRRRSLPARREGDAQQVSVPFDDAPAALLVWPAPASAAATAQVHPAGRAVDAAPPLQAPPQQGLQATELSGPWEVSLLPALDNRWGDLDWPPAPGAPPLQRWTVSYRREAPGEDGLTAGWALPPAPA